ncbi:MAG TPA: tyrosine--tRNA ligase [Mycobacteriales bacterium]|nr:tyrosine--tRNA ligase [Mycobacteriales bacterium]
MTADILDELEWRGLLAQSTDPDALRKDLADGPLTLYAGFDPTADSLHAGNLMPLLTLRRFQLFGHRPIVLAGGATGLIGDPSGRDTERSLSDPQQIAARVEQKLRPQLARFVDLGGEALLVNNLDWTAPLSAIDFLRDVGKHFSVNVMLSKDSVAARLGGDGISFTEFSYMLLQSNDYLELYRRHGCKLQIGATDQWGNITAGLDLIRRVERGSAHALTVPLVTDSNGVKFGKSSGGGSLWLDPAMTSPYAFFQYFVNVADADVGRYLRYFTFLPREEIEALDRETAERPQARSAARRLAEEITTLVHGREETDRVIAASAALFGQGALEALDAATLGAALREAPHVELDGPLPNVVDLLVATGLCPSKSAARRAVDEGGAYLNNTRVTDGDAAPNGEDLLAGGWIVLRRGKRSLAGVLSTAGTRGS